MNAAESSAAELPISRREVFAWTLYDWANSAYSTILITIIVAYIKLVVLPGNAGTLAYGWGIGISTLVAAFLSPIIGAIADAHASKRRWLATMALGGAACAVLMALIPSQHSWLIIAAFFFTSLGFELSLGLYNGFLPEITTRETIDRVSAYGFALGYVGGALLLIMAMLITMSDDQLSPWVPDKLQGDFNETTDGEFAIELAPGKYGIILTTGDASQARDQMAFTIGGQAVVQLSTARGRYETRSFEVEHPGGELIIGIKGFGSEPGGAVINALAIQSVDGGSMVPPLDFGTPGSAVKTGHVWVAPDDVVQSWTLEDKGITQEQQRESGLPATWRFGWKRGEINANDHGLGIRLRVGILLMGLWWGAFSIPSILFLRDRGIPSVVRRSVAETASHAMRRVGGTIRNVRVYRTLSLFLLGFLIYNDGVQTVISQASVFGIEVLEMGATELAGLILMIQFLAIPGAMLIAFLAKKLGQRPTLMMCLAVWIGIVCAAYFITQRWQFWIMGVAVALVMGGTQSVSRAIMGNMTPKAHTAEFFGFYNLSGKATSFVGPILFVTVLGQTGQPHVAIVSLLIFFLVGAGIVSRLDFARGRREAGADAEL